MRMKENTSDNSSEPFNFGRSCVRDGVLRAYATRFGLLAFVFGVIALLSLGFAVYVRLQPPTIIRILPNGEANVISGRPPSHKGASAILANTATSPEPMDYEKQRIIEDFLDCYLNYDFKNVGDRWACALNLTTDTLQRSALDVMKNEDRIGKVRSDKVRSTFQIRQLEPSKQDSMAYTVYGIRNVYRMDGTREVAEQMVNRYEIHLALLDRSSQTPRGLLIGGYREMQLEGEQKELLFAADTGGIGPDEASNR